ncbi:MAG: phage tail tape measure protein, partial [Holophagales bacterium]|nr:phage tail tape measure protein [Holophagales bacterium]
MLAGVGLAVKSAMDSEAAAAKASIAHIQANGTNLLDQVASTISDLKGGKSKSQLTQMASGMLSTGATTEQINSGGLKAAHDLSILGDLDDRVAGEMMANLSQNSGITNYEKLTDIIVSGAHASGVGIDKMGAALASLSSHSKELGISGEVDLKDIAGTMTALSMNGVENSESVIASVMNAIPNMGQNLQRGRGWRAQEGAGLLREYGLENLVDKAFDKNGELQADSHGSKWGNINAIIAGITEAKNKSGKEINTQDKTKLLSGIFGNGAAQELAKLNFGTLNDATEKMDSQGSVQEKLSKITETTAFRFQKLKNDIMEMAVTIGQTVMPVVKQLVEKVSNIVGAITNWIKEHPKLATGLTIAAGVLGILLTMAGGVITGLAMLSLAFGTATGGVWAFTAALLANPITWIAIAIVAAAALIIAYWEPISNFFSDLWERFKAGGAAVDVLLMVMAPMIAIPLRIVKYWDKIKEFFSGFCAGFKEEWGDTGSAFGEI